MYEKKKLLFGIKNSTTLLRNNGDELFRKEKRQQKQKLRSWTIQSSRLPVKMSPFVGVQDKFITDTWCCGKPIQLERI